MRKTWIGGLLAGALAMAAVAGQEQAEGPALELHNAWVRAMPPSQPNTAAYMSLHNPTTAAIGITGASAKIAQSVEIHTTTEVDGYVRMQQLPGLALAAGESLGLAPGGTHLMLLGLTFMPEPGDTVELCLKLLAGGEVCTEAETRRAAPEAGNPHRHH